MTDDKEEPPKISWRKVRAPKPWHPHPTEGLIGHYVGTRDHNGTHGAYKAVYVRTSDGVFYVTGTVLINLVNSAGLEAGALIRIDYLGMRDSVGGSYPYKDFDLFVAQFRPCAACGGSRPTEARYCPHCGVL